MSVLEHIANAVANERPGAPASGKCTPLTLHLLDTIGAWIAGCDAPEATLVRRLRGPSAAASVLDDVCAACATIRLTEIDDIHLPSCTTPGSTIVPIVLLLARTLPAIDGRIAGAAMAAGYRTMIRLGEAIRGAHVLYRGIWPTYFAAPVAAAATTSRLLGLDERATAHALSIALTMSAGGVGRTSASLTSRWLLLGEAARMGCTAAFAAKEGMISDLTLLDADWLAQTHGIEIDPAPLGDGFGDADAPESVSFKPWCSAKQAIAATHAFERLMATGVAVRDITEIRVEAPPPYAAMIASRLQPGARLSAISSAANRIALAACDRDGLYDILPNGPAPAAADVAQLMARVTVTGAADLMAHFPALWPARVSVVTASGEVTETVAAAPGDPGTTFGEREIVRKFHRYADARLGAAGAEAWVDAVRAAFDGKAQFCRVCELVATLPR